MVQVYIEDYTETLIFIENINKLVVKDEKEERIRKEERLRKEGERIEENKLISINNNVLISMSLLRELNSRPSAY